MAHSFSITDGTTTFSLTSTNAMLINYDMGTAAADEATATDTVDLLIYAANGGAVQTAARTLGALLDAAHRRQQWGVGPRVYVQAQLDSDSAAWRSEIIKAKLDLNESSLAVWGNYKFEARLHIERRPYWEGALTQIPLSNGNGTADTGGLPVFNNSDGTGSSPSKQHNYLEIAAAAIVGDLPAPLKLQLTSTTSANTQYCWLNFWIANNAFNDPENFTHILEGEDRVAGYGSDTADAACSAGDYYTFTQTTYTTPWAITAALAQDCGGYPLRVLARMVASLPTGFFRPYVYDSTSTQVLYTGTEVEIPANNLILDLGIVPIPPGQATTLGGVRLALGFRAATSQTVKIDFLQLTPAYACRNYYQRQVGIANGDIITFDEIEGQHYYTNSGVDYPVFVARGTPLQVWPVAGKQRIYVLAERNQTGGSYLKGDSWTAKAWYRPRRSAI